MLAMMVPAFGIIALQYRDAVEAQQVESELGSRRFARELASLFEHEVAIRKAQLAALATSPSLLSGDYAGFYQQAQAALRATGGWVVLLNETGKPILSTRRSFAAELPNLTAPGFVNQVAEGEIAHVSDVVRSPLTDSPVISISQPLSSSGLVLSSYLSSAELSEVLSRVVPAGWICALIDRRGTVLARSKESEQYAGKQAAPDILAATSDRPDGWMFAHALNGSPVYASWQRLSFGFTALVAVAKDRVEQPMNAWERQVFGTAALFTLLGLVAAGVVGRWIGRSTQNLLLAAQNLGRGLMVTPFKSKFREINEIGTALGRASLERRRAEEALRASEARFRAIFDQLTAGIVVTDVTGRFQVVNERYCQMVGYSADELASKRIQDITHPEDLARNAALMKQLAEQGTAYQLEKRNICKDGSVVDVLVGATPILDAAGRPQQMLSVVLDVTERKRAQHELDRTASLLKIMTDTTPDLVYAKDRESRLLMANPALLSIFDKPWSEVERRSSTDLFDDRTVASTIRSNDLRVITEGRVHSFEETVFRSDGTPCTFLSTKAPMRDQSGAVVGIVGISTDITDRKRSEIELARLAEERARLVETLDRAPVMIRDLEGTILFWNAGLSDLFGFSKAEAIGHKAHDLLHTVFPKPIEDIRAELLAAGSWQGQLHCRKKNGDVVVVASKWALAHEGEHTSIVEVSADITEQKQYEARIRLLLRELSHRSKNLLAVVQAMARQTAHRSDNVWDFENKFAGRVQALAQAHDLLVRKDWAGVPIEQLVQTLIVPFAKIDGKRVVISGPDLIVNPQSAQNIGLALHELAVNATDYGALSVPTGVVRIAWGFDELGEGVPGFWFMWRETGGPSVSSPMRDGFGRLVLERMVPAALDGHIEFLPSNDGLTWTLTLPASHLVIEGESIDLVPQNSLMAI